MGRRRNKDLAESQFNANAAPVNLQSHFDLFKSPEIIEDLVEPVNEEISLGDIFHFSEDTLPLEPQHLVQLADDLLSQQVDRFEDVIESVKPIINTNIDYTDYLDFMDVLFQEYEFERKDLIEEIIFQSQHQEITDQLNFECSDGISVAINLVEIAIDKMSDEERRKFRLKDTVNQYFSNHLLINRSVNSIKFINDLGFRLLDKLKNQKPNLFKNFPDQQSLMIEWFNKNSNVLHEFKFPIMCFIIAIKLKESDIRLNSNCALKMGFQDYGESLTVHQLLHFLNLRSIDVTSDHFTNLLKVVFNFNKVYGGRRLYLLERIGQIAIENELFFKSDNYLFAELTNSRFKNEGLNSLGNSIDERILRNLKMKSSLLFRNRDQFYSPRKSLILTA